MKAFDPTPLRPDVPAIPMQSHQDVHGLTARQYAAIALCVPNSGTEWLDEMINKRRRDEFAKAAIASYLATRHLNNPAPQEVFAASSFRMADAMLAASKKEEA